MACSRNATANEDYNTNARRIKYVGTFRGSAMAESEVIMGEAVVDNSASAAAPAVETTVVEETPAATTVPAVNETAAVVESAAPAAPATTEASQESAAPVKAMETADLLSMNRQQLAEFTAQVTSDASSKVEEMNRQMQAQQEELATLRAEHQKRVEEEQNQQRKAFEDKMNELKNEGFNQDGLLMGIETMAKTGKSVFTKKNIMLNLK